GATYQSSSHRVLDRSEASMAKEPDHPLETGPKKRKSTYAAIEESAERRIRELEEANAALRQEVAEWRGMSDSPSAVRHREEAVIDAIPGFVAVLSADGRVDFVNRRILEYSGQSKTDFANWATDGTVHQTDVPHVAATFERSIASGTPF